MIKDLTLHNRAQQVVDAITENNADLDATTRQKKFAAMSESAYRFFRGTSHLFWQDMYDDALVRAISPLTLSFWERSNLVMGWYSDALAQFRCGMTPGSKSMLAVAKEHDLAIRALDVGDLAQNNPA